MELIARKEIFPHWIIYALMFSIAVLSILKYQREYVFVNLRMTFFKSPSSVSFSKEEIKFFGSTNWVLLINYFLVTTLAMYMVLIYHEISNNWLMLLPIVYYAFQILAMFFVGVLSGELKRLRENILLLNFTSHFIGLLFIPILFAWILNPGLSPYLFNSLIVLFSALHLLRILRGVFIALRNKVLWYYIILYLCALEIWPVLTVYLIVSPAFIE
ncbi:MAG TPA: DUF4271 domain-containing protein [Brumimicrobium sp.]|nr:DUF4271 domain-containing protein [Brumimicrobium sp.]